MLPQHGLSDIDKNGQDVIHGFTISPKRTLVLTSMMLLTLAVFFLKFVQIGLDDVDIALNKRDALPPVDWYLLVDAMPQRV